MDRGVFAFALEMIISYKVSSEQERSVPDSKLTSKNETSEIEDSSYLILPTRIKICYRSVSAAQLNFLSVSRWVKAAEVIEKVKTKYEGISKNRQENYKKALYYPPSVLKDIEDISICCFINFLFAVEQLNSFLDENEANIPPKSQKFIDKFVVAVDEESLIKQKYYTDIIRIQNNILQIKRQNKLGLAENLAARLEHYEKIDDQAEIAEIMETSDFKDLQKKALDESNRDILTIYNGDTIQTLQI